ncbi:MAG: type I DNA topoisomerase [Nitrospirae bacterium CG_4_10_14_3_um_filter_44_29]|nr:type I DNA topoisomerase [Nitrospirota bacterium]OIO28948.1 MAG: DNA topoisomerase I [Nitrospirae bacterium CG1_02_44_142]PIP71153.1 MAG: DNA topoisomerase I [Nitrospirae bacterium CG22_combo_CG10-13_8_21_14_all_44_11]PIV41387.1 MAG: type I DNA topoisomerase [Nitrospirae bacterium CG02_land_8_20_14_3_00_44_33]PIV66013.1 MAG: type I DNA topoisomerase [Nitrospirae bacterium CG01_land_8_20_14_3_00_44_22]PIW88630.1 MAG: type I DNA topoisomerase [Nitrospirae bacterium CG_4_8_14_3_um_filter_44_28
MNSVVIVESPAKSRTINKILGKDFIVKASIGHIRDLVEGELGVDVNNNFQPKYEVPAEKKKVVAELKKIVKGADVVWLATDEDREGEAIAWHLSEVLGLSENKTRRITYSEITKDAIQKAIKNPRTIDKSLVDAQQARRVLDRLVGYEISPILWKKVKPALSAGRVQSVAVRLIVEREREIQNFKSVSSYKVSAVFLNEKNEIVKAELPKKFQTKEEAKAFLEKCKGAEFSIAGIETKPAKKSPSAPFTTSTLQQEAGRKFGYSVAQTMRIAQGLYESGKITYMRTDSVNLSDTALGQAKNEIEKLYGKDFLNIRRYKTKSKGAQEAHEAIRPANLGVYEIEGDAQERRIYDLIWKRTIASQMSDALLEKTTAAIRVSTTEEKFAAQGEVLKFEGFLKVYLEGKDEENEENAEGVLPPLKIGEKLSNREITAVERFTYHPPRYTEATLVRKLEELGIGRPSTYAPTIFTIQKRNYVVKEDRDGVKRNFSCLTLKNGNIIAEEKSENTGAEKSKLFPTDVGMVVNDFLMDNFKDIMDFNFTAKVEEEFDEIAGGKLVWTKMLAEFYKPFHKTVEDTAETSARQSGERVLGKDPVTGKQVLVRLGKFGPIVQIGRQDDKEKPRYASLRKNQRMDAITFEQAMELFKLPRSLGTHKGDEVLVNIGRFGPYIKYQGGYVSLPKDEDPNTISLERAKEILNGPRLPKVLGQFQDEDVIAAKGRFGPYVKYKNIFASLGKGEDPLCVTLERAIELVTAKEKKELDKIIKAWAEDARVRVVNGRYGPCIQSGKKFFRIPAGKKPQDITLEECLSLAGLNEEKKKPKAASAKGKTKAKTRKTG